MSDEPADDDRRLFREAVADARPLPRANRVSHPAEPDRPIPRRIPAEPNAAVRSSVGTSISLEDRPEAGDEAQFIRAGLANRVVRDLRRGRWPIDAELDLHGATRDEARLQVAGLLAESLRRDWRCLRIVHGKGWRSPGGVGLLKTLVRGWLMQRDEVLAYCQARPEDGGEGALIALLRARQRQDA